jgi:hypothetical protein
MLAGVGMLSIRQRVVIDVVALWVTSKGACAKFRRN